MDNSVFYIIAHKGERYERRGGVGRVLVSDRNADKI